MAVLQPRIMAASPVSASSQSLAGYQHAGASVVTPSIAPMVANRFLMCSAAVPVCAAAAASMHRRRRCMNGVRMQVAADAEVRQALDVGAVVQPNKVTDVVGSTESLTGEGAIPFLPDPAYRRFVRNVPGDAGFDPLGLAGADAKTFVTLYESELKHGRIAMLAGVGFAASELLHPRLAATLGLPNLMGEGGCAPTLLNGGLFNPLLASSLALIFGTMSLVDITGPRKSDIPGYYGFDPLKLGDQCIRAEWMAEAEIKHSRVAMLAVVYMAFREFLTHTPTWPAL